MDTITFLNQSHCSEKERQKIIEAIRLPLIQFNLSHISKSRFEHVLLTASKEHHILGGLIGRMAYDWLEIELLWLDDSIRKEGYGKILLSQAEEIAISFGCIGAHLNTFSFQAPGFYMKQGYDVFGEIDDHPKGQKRYYLKKYFRHQV
jgi:GNAT superfamily N-acetyltransferase